MSFVRVLGGESVHASAHTNATTTQNPNAETHHGAKIYLQETEGDILRS